MNLVSYEIIELYYHIQENLWENHPQSSAKKGRLTIDYFYEICF